MLWRSPRNVSALLAVVSCVDFILHPPICAKWDTAEVSLFFVTLIFPVSSWSLLLKAKEVLKKKKCKMLTLCLCPMWLFYLCYLGDSVLSGLYL